MSPLPTRYAGAGAPPLGYAAAGTAQRGVPACVDKDKLVPLRLDGIVWWDTVHKECFISDYRKESKTQTHFPRNPDGT